MRKTQSTNCCTLCLFLISLACLFFLTSCLATGKQKASALDVKTDTKVGILQPPAQAASTEEAQKSQAGVESLDKSKEQDLQRTITENVAEQT